MTTAGRGELAAGLYEELQRLARARVRAGESLQATALVHEAWLRLAESPAARPGDADHMLAMAAQAMRWVTVDHARRRRSRRLETVAAEALVGEDARRDDELIAVDAALERLAEVHPEEARVVIQRYFGGLSVDETARSLGLSPATVKRRWAFARAWLTRELDAGPGTSSEDS